jgi:hypothetical protein
MQIRNPRYVSDQGYPVLEVEIEGRLARIPLEQKPIAYEAGIIFVGSEFESILPAIVFNSLTLRGCTNDPEILRLYDEFGQAVEEGRFEPGPV